MVSGQLMVAALWCYGYSASKYAVGSSGAMRLPSPSGLRAKRPGMTSDTLLGVK